MATKVHSLETYEELAGLYDRQGQAKLRDWFLILAADAALTLGQDEAAERLRRRLLHVNPHHLLQPFRSLAEALTSADVAKYVAELRKRYPLETAEHLLLSAKKKPVVTAAKVEPAPPRQEEPDLKVFRGKVKSEIAPPLQEPKRPILMPSLPLPVAWERVSSNSDSPARSENEGAEQATRADYWVATLLCLGTALTGIGLLLYLVLIPFLAD